MTEIFFTGLLVSAGLFLTGLLVLPAASASVSGFWPGGKLVRARLRQAAGAAIWLRGRPDQFNDLAPADTGPLQVVSGAIALMAGLVCLVVFSFPSGGWILLLLAGVSGYQLPILLLRQKLAARKGAVLRELPEIVGLLRAFAGRNLATSLSIVTRTRQGPLATAIRQALERNATGIPLLTALLETTAGLQVEEVGMFLVMLSQAQASSTRNGELPRVYEQELLSRRRETALQQVETAEGKISAVLTVATALQLLLLLVVPSLLQFLGPGTR